MRAVLVRGASGTFVLKIFAAGLGFLASLLLARLLGAAGYGAYAYAQSWLTLLAVLATLGLDTLLVRNIAAYRARSDWSLMSGLLRQANRTVLATSIGLALLAATVAWFLRGHLEPQMLPAFLVAMCSLPLVALIYLRQAAMRGLQRVVVGQLPETLIRPLLLIALIGCVYLSLGDDPGAAWAMGLNVAATAVAFLIGARLLRKALPQAATQAYPDYKRREWMRSALPLLILTGMGVTNAQVSTILLGTMQNAEVAGVYAVVTQAAGLITFILGAANVVMAPAIATMYAAGDTERLQRMVTKSARLVLLFSLPLALCLMLFGYWLLSFFGEEFVRGSTALAVLSLGYLANAATGSVGTLLTMTGYARDAAVVVGVSVVLNIVLNVFLIPGWGLEGAAAATATSMIVWNLLLAILAYRRLGIHASALGRIG